MMPAYLIAKAQKTDRKGQGENRVAITSESVREIFMGLENGDGAAFFERVVSLVVEKAVAAVKFHPDGRNVSITAGKFPPVEADIDARNLESAIYNLLLNACQAATRSTHLPEVKVHLTEVDERIYVTIFDNGPGIPASVRRTLFDPFVTAGKPNGTGLGLTLALQIAEAHGGSVCLEESNREGTVFTLSLTKNRLLDQISKSCIRSDHGSMIVGHHNAIASLRRQRSDLTRGST
jgi:signal transduction histidine kinase